MPAPGSELPCVWMSAGVMTYRLCDREYDCETCPLHLALRGGSGPLTAVPVSPGGSGASPASDDPVGRYLQGLGAGCTLYLDRAYGADGLWAEAEPSGSVRIGLDDYTLRLLEPVDSVTVPRLGVWLGHSAPCAWLNRGRLQIALRCPVAGEVIEIHDRPSLTVGTSGEGTVGEGAGRWLFRLTPHEPLTNAPGLYRNEALLAWYLSRVHAVHEQLEQVSAAVPAGVGPVLNDGGMTTSNLEIVLGRERFEALVGTLFPLQV